MKLVKYDMKKERGKLRLYTSWKNQMREPVALEMRYGKADDYNPSETVEFQDSSAMMHLLSGFAEIAWAKGWRPRGLVNTMAHVVANYKEPPAK